MKLSDPDDMLETIDELRVSFQGVWTAAFPVESTVRGASQTRRRRSRHLPQDPHLLESL